MPEKVSIVIPCRNEEAYISGCLNSVVNSDYPGDMLQIFVCDGMSTDKSVEKIQFFVDKYENVKLLKNEKKTTPFALNLGIKKSDSDIIIILGAHSQIFPDYISKCVHYLDKHKEAGCVGGIIENIYENNKSEAIGLALSSGFGVGNVYFRTGTRDGYVDTVAFGAYRKEVFDKIGFFDESLSRNQDDEFNFRLTRSGYKILLNREIRSKYYVRSSFAKLFRQYFQYGLWKVFVNQKYKTITTMRQLFPLFFILFLLGGGLVSLFSNMLFYLYAGVIGLYLLLGIVMSLKKSMNFFIAAKVFLTFLILHISYGMGYLTGIIRFLILKQKPGVSDEVLSR